MVKNHFYDYEGSYLFSKEEMFPRESVERADFNISFAPISMKVKDAILAASVEIDNIMSIYPHFVRNKALIASLWNDLILEKIVRTRGIESGRLQGNKRRAFFKVGRSKVFVKKVDTAYRTSNIETGQVAEFRDQLSSNANDRSPVLFLGYQLDETGRHITNASIICRRGEQLEWVTDVLNFNDAPRTFKTRVFITLDDEPDYKVSVKPGLKSKSV